MASIRLQRFLSQAGVASRRHSEALITAGKVRVNGQAVTELGTRVDPERDVVEVSAEALGTARGDGPAAGGDGKRKGGRAWTAVEVEPLVYLVMNKPKGSVTTVTDPQGRPTVMDLLPPDLPAHVVPVGRLDFYTEGVLLFTNDGDLAAGLLAPRSAVEKTYHAKLRGKVTDEQLERLRRGVRLDDGRVTAPAKVDRLKYTGTHSWLVITIHEGRTRQIHRMADSVGLQVIKLARVAFGGLTYFGLKIGEVRPLTKAEVQGLRRLAGVDESGPTARPRASLSPRPRKIPFPAPGKAGAGAHEDGGDVEPLRPAAGRAPERPVPGSHAGTAGERPRSHAGTSGERSRPRTASRTGTSGERSRPRAGSRTGTAGERSRPRAGSRAGTAGERSRPRDAARGGGAESPRAVRPRAGGAERPSGGPRRTRPGRPRPARGPATKGPRAGGRAGTRRPAGRGTGPTRPGRDRRTR